MCLVTASLKNSKDTPSCDYRLCPTVFYNYNIGKNIGNLNFKAAYLRFGGKSLLNFHFTVGINVYNLVKHSKKDQSYDFIGGYDPEEAIVQIKKKNALPSGGASF